MYSFNIKISNHVIGFETEHVRLKSMCRDFITEESPDFYVKTTQKDIDEQKNEIDNMPSLWDGSVETMCALKKVADKLLDCNTILMHGAVIASGGNAFIFTGKSGTGKTTHVMKWHENLPDACIVNGDKPFIVVSDCPIVIGSPWSGKESQYANIETPLSAIIFMERSYDGTNRIHKITFQQAFPKLLQATYRPHDKDGLRKTLDLIKKLGMNIRFYDFQFNNYSDDVFKVAYQALCGEERD